MARRRDDLVAELKSLDVRELASAVEELGAHLRTLDAEGAQPAANDEDRLAPADAAELSRRADKALRGEGLIDVDDDDALFDELGLL